MESVYADCGLDPLDTQYVEAHGIGTKAGDKTDLAIVYGALVEGEIEGVQPTSGVTHVSIYYPL